VAVELSACVIVLFIIAVVIVDKKNGFSVVLGGLSRILDGFSVRIAR
jgi:uncharacterized membrane protein